MVSDRGHRAGGGGRSSSAWVWAAAGGPDRACGCEGLPYGWVRTDLRAGWDAARGLEGAECGAGSGWLSGLFEPGDAWPGPDGAKMLKSTICGWNMRGLAAE